MSRLVAIATVGTIFTGCTSSQPSLQGSDTSSTTMAVRVVGPVRWSACGAIDCGELRVHAVPEDPASPVTGLSIFRRAASTVEGAETLLLLPDRDYGYDARQLAELAPVLLGADVNRFDIVSIEPRGWPGVSMPVGFEHRVASLDSVDDLEILRAELGVESASVVAWGRGATIAAAWKMLHPGSVAALVLDTPGDPSSSMRRQGIAQAQSSASSSRAAVKWCAAHLSCPLNANTTADVRKILKHMRDGRLDPRVTRGLLARAAVKSLAEGDPRTLFVGLVDADGGDASTLVDLAGASPGVDDARSACADVSQGSASAIVKVFTTMTKSKRLLFHVGVEGPVYSMCGDLPAPARPIGAVRPLPGAVSGKVMTVVADGDPTWPEATVKKMATRMRWTHRTVRLNRHLVVGFDRATTAAAIAFLTS